MFSVRRDHMWCMCVCMTTLHCDIVCSRRKADPTVCCVCTADLVGKKAHALPPLAVERLLSRSKIAARGFKCCPSTSMAWWLLSRCAVCGLLCHSVCSLCCLAEAMPFSLLALLSPFALCLSLCYVAICCVSLHSLCLPMSSVSLSLARVALSFCLALSLSLLLALHCLYVSRSLSLALHSLHTLSLPLSLFGLSLARFALPSLGLSLSRPSPHLTFHLTLQRSLSLSLSLCVFILDVLMWRACVCCESTWCLLTNCLLFDCPMQHAATPHKRVQRTMSTTHAHAKPVEARGAS